MRSRYRLSSVELVRNWTLIKQFEAAIQILGSQQRENPAFFRQSTQTVVGGDAQKEEVPSY